MGPISGITGVVTKPIEGARAEGGGFSFGGLMKGMATGIVGVVAQPVKGVADMISDVGKGIDSSTARLHGFKSVERLRAVPPPSRWLTLPYNHNSAVASTFLRQWQGATCSRPLLAAVLDLTGHSDWRCSVMVKLLSLVYHLQNKTRVCCACVCAAAAVAATAACKCANATPAAG